MSKQDVIDMVVRQLNECRYGPYPDYSYGYLHGMLVIAATSGTISGIEFTNLMSLSRNAVNNAKVAA